MHVEPNGISALSAFSAVRSFWTSGGPDARRQSLFRPRLLLVALAIGAASALRAMSATRAVAPAHAANRLHRRGRRHHPSDRHRLHPARDCAGRCRQGRPARHRAPHAGRTRRLDARHQHRHHPVEDAGRGLRLAVGQSRRVGRISHHHRGRRRRHGARHAHRRRASGVGRRPEGRRHDGEEDDVRRRRLRPDDSPRSASATSPWSSRRSPRAGPSPSRRPWRQPAAHRPHRDRSARPAEEARRPHDPCASTGRARLCGHRAPSGGRSR